MRSAPRSNQGGPPYYYPEGTVIVKEQYKNLGQLESASTPNLTIMIKLGEGESPQTGGWGYVKGFKRKVHISNSNPAKFCGGCHKAANLKKRDYVFVNARSFPQKANLLQE